MAIVIKKTLKAEDTPVKKIMEESGLEIDLSNKDRLFLVKKMYKQAKTAEPDQDSLEEEMKQYLLQLPTGFDLATMQESHKLFALINSFIGRIVEIEAVANGNKSRWERLMKLMKAYLDERGSEILLSEECMDLPNAKLQDAFVRKELKKHYAYLATFTDKVGKASAFFENVIGKRKYLNSTYQSLSRQVSTLESELRSLNG